VVERTAHNGLVVGSIPTGPNHKYLMKLTSKEYRIIKIKNYLKKNNLFFFFNGINQNSNNWIKTEQELKNLNLKYYKIFNKTTINTFKNSIFINSRRTINGVTFVIKPVLNSTVLTKKMLFTLYPFVFLSIKLNTNIYSYSQISCVNSFNYYSTKLLLYQFGITAIKSYFH
jgi:hypothetical protein